MMISTLLANYSDYFVYNYSSPKSPNSSYLETRFIRFRRDLISPPYDTIVLLTDIPLFTIFSIASMDKK